MANSKALKAGKAGIHEIEGSVRQESIQPVTTNVAKAVEYADKDVARYAEEIQGSKPMLPQTKTHLEGQQVYPCCDAWRIFLPEPRQGYAWIQLDWGGSERCPFCRLRCIYTIPSFPMLCADSKQYSWLETILHMGILVRKYPTNFLLQKLLVAKHLAAK